jgi:hypothetical protein
MLSAFGTESINHEITEGEKERAVNRGFPMVMLNFGYVYISKYFPMK